MRGPRELGPLVATSGTERNVQRKEPQFTPAALDSAAQLWRSYGDPRPPVDQLAVAIREHSAEIVADAIRTIGDAGRLGDYRPHFARFCSLREQSRRWKQELRGSKVVN